MTDSAGKLFREWLQGQQPERAVEPEQEDEHDDTPPSPGDLFAQALAGQSSGDMATVEEHVAENGWKKPDTTIQEDLERLDARVRRRRIPK